MVIISDPSIHATVPACTPPVKKGESSAWGLLPSPLPFLVYEPLSPNLVGGLGRLPALPPMADPLKTMVLEVLEPPKLVHSLSLPGAADSFSHLQWLFLHPEMGKETMPHRGERIERNLSSAFPHCRRHKQQGQQRCLWLVPTEAALAPPPHPSITSLSLVYTKICRYDLHSHGWSHTQQTAQGWLKKPAYCK